MSEYASVPAAAEETARKVDGYRRYLEDTFVPLLPGDHRGKESLIAKVIRAYRWFPADGEDGGKTAGNLVFTEGRDLGPARRKATVSAAIWTAFKRIPRETTIYSMKMGQEGVKMDAFGWFVDYVGITSGEGAKLDLRRTLMNFEASLDILQAILDCQYEWLEDVYESGGGYVEEEDGVDDDDEDDDDDDDN